MNIDFIPSAKSSSTKVSASSSDSASVDSAKDGSGEGFFAKLSALFKGDEKASLKGEKSGTEHIEGKGSAVETEDSDIELAKAAKQEQSVAKAVDGDSIDELSEMDTGTTSKASKVTGDAETETASKNKYVATLDTKEKVTNESTLDAKKVMGDGDEILAKLKQANQALSTSNQISPDEQNAKLDGKDLPSKNSTVDTETAEDGNVAAKLMVGTKAAEQLVSDDVSNEASTSSHITLDSVVSEKKATVNSQDSSNSKTEIPNASFSSLDVAEAEAKSEMVSTKVVDDEMKDNTKGSTDTQRLQTDEDLLKAAFVGEAAQKLQQNVQEMEPESQTVESDGKTLVSELEHSTEKKPENIHGIDVVDGDSEGAKELSSDEASLALSSSQLAESKTAVKQDSSESGDAKSKAPLHSPLSLGAASSVAVNAATVEKTGDVASELQGKVLTQSSEKGLNDDLVPKAMLDSESSKLANSDAKLVKHQQLTAMNQAGTVSMPNSLNERLTVPQPIHTAAAVSDVTNAQSLSAAVPVAAAAIGGMSMLSNDNSKAKWSSERLEASGLMAQESDRSQSQVTGKEGHFAQQLASLSGVTGQQAPQAQRMEMIPTQTPIMVNKDVAADQLSERVQMMLSKNLKNIDIRLDPPELGRMHIRMNMNGDAATVHFTVANQHVRDALEGSLPRLREMLAQQGVQLGDTGVQQQSSSQQQGYAAGGRSGSQSEGNFSGEFGAEDENMPADVKLKLNVGAKRDGISYYA